jgi:PKHD-type hydroxylase
MSFTHIEIPNFLTKEECKILLEFSLKNLKLDTARYSPEGKIGNLRKSKIQFYPYYDKFPFLLNKINGIVEEHIKVKGHDLEYKKEQFQFTQYNVGDYFDWHGDKEYGTKDKLILGRYCSVVLQLNDEYEGGELEVELPNGDHIVVKKDIGNLIIFLSEIKHRVTCITSGVRYTLVNWIGTKPKENYKKTLL